MSVGPDSEERGKEVEFNPSEELIKNANNIRIDFGYKHFYYCQP